MKPLINFQTIIFSTVLFLVPAIISAQQTVQKFTEETNYLLLLPDDYRADTTLKWPLVLFLHGSGESGFDIEKVKAHGPPQQAALGRKFPFILVSPQSEVPSGWDIEKLYRLLQYVKKNYRVDIDRIYLTGLSMGGFGTWALAIKHPEEFAAIAPICGGGDTTDAWKIRNIPVWCFHGANDNIVPPVSSINLVNATKKFNRQVTFTLYANTSHNSWDTTYNNDSIYKWLLIQKKFTYKETTINTTQLKKYPGSYLGPDGDTVEITINQQQLIAKPGKEIVPLKPAGDNLFFLRADRNMDIQFNFENGIVTSFWFLGDRKLLYRKL